MKKLSFFLTASLSIALSVAYPQALKPVKITGNIINSTDQSPKVIKFNFTDPFIDESPSVRVIGSEKFGVEQDILHAYNMTVNYANYFINLLVKPGDSVHLTIDASKLDQPKFAWVNITGDDAKVKAQLNLCADYIYHLKPYDYNMELPPAEMLAMVKQDYNRYLLAIDKYAAEYNLAPTVIDWAKIDIKYVIANHIVDYGTNKSLSLKEKQQRLAIFSDPFFDIYNAENFQSMYFPYHLQAIAARSVKFYQDINDKTKPSELLKKTLAQLNKLPMGESRDYMLYMQLKRVIRANPELKTSITNPAKYFTTSAYAKNFQAMVYAGNKKAFADVKISGVKYLNTDGATSSLPGTNIIAYLAAKYPGKVLYIDVYATWCGPCLEEMKSSPALYKAIKGKDVVFVNLCLGSTAKDWVNLIKEKEMEGEHYFFDGDASKQFISTYKLPGYPSYLLVNRKGLIATNDALRPSAGEKLFQSIDKLITE